MNLNGIGNLPGMLRPTHPDPRTRVENGQTGHAVPAPAQTAVRPTREATPASENVVTPDPSHYGSASGQQL